MGHHLGSLAVEKELLVHKEACLKRFETVAVTGSSRTLTSYDYGKLLLLSYEGAVAITLPANGAPEGTQIDFLIIGSNACIPTWTAATADTLISANEAAADSVTYGSGSRVGAYLRLISTGTYWVAVNLGSTTLTVTG